MTEAPPRAECPAGPDRRELVPGLLGLGTAPLGNMFRAVGDDEDGATTAATWSAGVRYFDTAPSYAAGLAELRLGVELGRHGRDEYVVSTKVGRLILDEPPDPAPAAGALFRAGRAQRVVDDYSADGTRRSIEGSLDRLGLDRLDIVWVHDLAPNVQGDEWLSHFEDARRGAFAVLDAMRDEGVIRAWGIAVNPTEPVERLLGLEEVRPDAFLLAGRYTLLDHRQALGSLLPAAVAAGVGMVVGAPYNSGALVGGTHFDYRPTTPSERRRVQELTRVAGEHGVSVKAAALQFCVAHPATVAVIPGATRPHRIAEDVAALDEAVPAQFWADLRTAGIVAVDAPTP